MKALAIPAKLELPDLADYPTAAAKADALRPFLAPARPTTILDWLAQLFAYKAAVAPPADIFEHYAEGIVETLGDQPALIWTRATLKHVMLSCNLWPEAARLGEILLPQADALRQRIAHLDQAASRPKVVGSRTYMHQQIAPPPPPPPLRERLRMKAFTPTEAADEDTKAEQRRARQLDELVYGPPPPLPSPEARP